MSGPVWESHYTALFNSLKSISEAACSILESAGTINSPVQQVVDSFDVLFDLCNEVIVAPSTLSYSAGEWSVYVRTARVLDRALALISALNAELLRSMGFSPFHGLIVDGEGLTTTVDRRLVALSRESGGVCKLHFSPGLVSAADAGAIRYVVPADVTDDARRYLLAGAAGDVLDLLSELRELNRLQQPLLTTIKASFERGCKPLRVDVRVRENWACGLLYDLDTFAVEINKEVSEVSRLTDENKVLALTMWDGTIVYPAVQISRNGKVYAQLPRLLKMLVTSWSRWHLALWLGTADDLDVVYATKLSTLDGFKSVEADLDEYEKIDKRSVVKASAKFPRGVQLEKARNSGLKAFLPSTPDALHYDPNYEDVVAESERPSLGWAEAEGSDLPGRMYRITRSGHGPFYYGHARDDGSGGRFDTSVEGEGTCYLAVDAIGAIKEVFGRVPVLSFQEVTSRSQWELIPVDKVGPLLDLTDKMVSDDLNLQLSIFGSRYRAATQRFADAVNQAGYRGVIHQLRNFPSGQGVALFGGAGRQGGHGHWHMRPVPLVAHQAFWNWLSSIEQTGQDFFPSQLPADYPRV